MSEPLRTRLIETARKMNASGLNQGTAGNLSARHGEGMLITPSGLDYDQLQTGDIVWVDGAGQPHGSRRPSSEWRFHLDIYRHFGQAAAVVHAHSPWCATLSCLHRPIPAFHYMVAIAGGRDIRCSAYATPGTQALSDHVISALQGRTACLMANHGMVCYGRDLDRALALALEVELLARMYGQAAQLGEPVLLSDKEMERMQQIFRSYGSNARDGA